LARDALDLLGDYPKAIMLGLDLVSQRGANMPAHLGSQAKASCKTRGTPDSSGWACRSNDLPASDVVIAFETGQHAHVRFG
jgi:hypothetical protein